MLTTWAKQEGEAATKEEVIYVLDGLVAAKVIDKASYEDITMLDLIYDADATRTAYGPFQT